MITIRRETKSPKELYCHYTGPIGQDAWDNELNLQQKVDWEKAWVANPWVNMLVEISPDGAFDLRASDKIQDSGVHQNVIYRVDGNPALHMWMKPPEAPLGFKPQPIPKAKDPIDHSKYRCINPAQ